MNERPKHGQLYIVLVSGIIDTIMSGQNCLENSNMEVTISLPEKHFLADSPVQTAAKIKLRNQFL